MKIRIALAPLLATLLGACSDSDANDYTGVPDIPAPFDANTAATWTDVYIEIVQPTCSGCHNPAGVGDTSGKLDMSSQDTAYANLVDVPAGGSACAGKGTRVTPSNAQTSVMYLKISPTDPSPCGLKMPLGGVSLPQSQVDQIASWINAGAMNN
jgi:hypothetical protein